MSAVDVLSLLIFTAVLGSGQVMFKKVGLLLRAHGVAAAMRDPTLYVALVLYAAATVLWIWILSRVPLSRAYPWVALATVFVPLAAWYWFREAVPPLFWLGTTLIALGLVLTQVAP